MICTVFAPVSWVFGVRSKFWMLKKGEMLYFTTLPNLFATRLHVRIPRRLKTHGWNDWTVTSDCVALHMWRFIANRSGYQLLCPKVGTFEDSGACVRPHDASGGPNPTQASTWPAERRGAAPEAPTPSLASLRCSAAELESRPAHADPCDLRSIIYL